MNKETGMHSAILNITFDCHSPRAVATFWGEVTGYSLQEVDTPGNDYLVASSLAAPCLGWCS
jgi:hypothetical protein